MQIFGRVSDYLRRNLAPSLVDKLSTADLLALRKTNEPPSARVAQSLRLLLQDAYRELKQLDYEVKAHWMQPGYDEVKAQQRALADAIEQSEKILAPFRRLPPEVLSIIISFLPRGKNSLDNKAFPLQALWLCRAWNKAVLADPTIWGYLHIKTQDLYARDCLRRVRKHLGRSYNVWLTIYIDSQEWHPSDPDEWISRPAFSLIVSVGRRWIRADLPLTVNAQPLLAPVADKFTNLQHLTIGLSDVNIIQNFQPLRTLEAFRETPYLQTLRLRHHVPLKYFLFPQDRSLPLSFYWRSFREHEQNHLKILVTVERSSSEQIRGALSSFTALEYFETAIGSLENIGLRDNDLYHSKFTCASLTSLILTQVDELGKNNCALIHAMAKAEWHKLERVTLPVSRRYQDELASFVRNIHPTLRKLEFKFLPELANDAVTGESLVYIIRQAKLLTSLYLFEENGHCPYLADALWLLNTPDSDEKQYPILHLQQISVMSDQWSTYNAFIGFILGRLDPAIRKNGIIFTPEKLMACAAGISPDLDPQLQLRLCEHFRMFSSEGVVAKVATYNYNNDELDMRDVTGGVWD